LPRSADSHSWSDAGVIGTSTNCAPASESNFSQITATGGGNLIKTVVATNAATLDAETAQKEAIRGGSEMSAQSF